MRESVRQGKSQWNLKEDSHRRSETRQDNTWHERPGGASDITRSASKWPSWESKDAFKHNDPSCVKTDADQHMDNGANKETGGWEAACSHRGGKSSPSGDETKSLKLFEQEKQNHSQKNCWEQLSRPVRTSGVDAIVRNDSNWPAWESSSAIKRTDPVHGKSDPVMDNSASKETRGWDAAKSYGIRRSSPSADETGQQNHNHFQKKGWDQLRRRRSRSRSTGRTLKWEGYEQGDISRNGSRKSSPSQKKSTAGSWDRGGQSRRDHNLSESGESLGLCKDFQAGRCRRGHDCRFLHSDGHRYRDEKSKRRESRYERAFRQDDEIGDNASRVKTSYNEGRGEPRKNITTSTDPCKYFRMGKCHRGSSCKFMHDSGYKFDRSNRIQIVDHEVNHGSPPNRKSKSQSQDDKLASVANDGQNMWNGPTWEGTDSVSKGLKGTRQDNHDVAKSNIIVERAADRCMSSHRRNDNRGHDNKPTAYGSGDALCKYLTTEKCRDGGRCRYSHGDPAERRPQSQDSRGAHVSDDVKKLWPAWGSSTGASKTANITGWGNNNDKNMDISDACSPVLKDKDPERDEHRYPEFVTGNYGAITGSHATGDGKNLWNGPSWDDKIAVSEAGKFTGWGNNSDVRNIKMTDTVATDSTSNCLGRGLDNGYHVHDSLTLKDKATSRGQQLSSEWGSEKGSAKTEPRFITAPPQSQMVNATNDVKTMWKGPMCRNEYLRSDKIAPSINNHMSESQESGKVCKNSANIRSVDSNPCRFSHDYPEHKKSISKSLVVKQTHATGDAKNSWTGPTWGDSIAVSETAKLTGWATDMKFDDPVATKSISSRLGHATADNNVKCAILILNDKAAQRDNHAPLSELVTGSDGAVLGDPEKIVDAQNYVKDEAQIRSMVTQSQKSNKENNACSASFSLHNEVDSSKKIVISEHVSSHGGLKPIVNENNQILPEKQTQGREGSYLKKVDVENWIDGGNLNTYVMFRNALVELVKEFLTPAWKDGRIGKEIYKLILKKVVDKVCGSMQVINIPQTGEQVDHYLATNQSSISQLIHDYVNIYQDSRPALAH